MIFGLPSLLWSPHEILIFFLPQADCYLFVHPVVLSPQHFGPPSSMSCLVFWIPCPLVPQPWSPRSLICCDLDLSPTIPTITETLAIISNITCSAGTLNKEALEKYDRKSWEIHTVKVAIGGRKKLQSGGGKKSSASAVTSEWKNLWLGMSLPEMLTNPISTPLSISDLHFFVLEGRKEKIPAYRGTGAPTHFQEQVGWGTWLGLELLGQLKVSFITFDTRRRGAHRYIYCYISA